MSYRKVIQGATVSYNQWLLRRHLNIPVMSSMESHHQEVIGFLRQGWRSYYLTYLSFLVNSVVDPDSDPVPVVP
jgi:hypothetical protein